MYNIINLIKTFSDNINFLYIVNIVKNFVVTKRLSTITFSLFNFHKQCDVVIDYLVLFDDFLYIL